MKLFHVFGLCPLPVDGKRALVGWKTIGRDRPPAWQVERWFDNRPNATGIAGLLGNPSGKVRERDFDSRESYREWAGAFPCLAKTLPTFMTLRGAGVLYAADAPSHCWNVAGVDCKRVRGKGDGEFRGGDGYCLLPPSRHPDDHRFRYGWINVPETHGWPWIKNPWEVGLCPPPEQWPEQPRNQPQRHQQPHQPEQPGQQPEQHTMVVGARVLSAVRRSVPGRVGERDACVFELAGRLCGLGLSEAGQAAAFASWWTLAEPIVGTKDRAVSEAAFWRATAKRATPGWGFGVGSEFRAKCRAAASGDTPAERVASVLRGMAGADGRLFIARATLAVEAGVTESEARTAIKKLTTAGALFIEVPGQPWIGGRATAYRWIGG